MASWVAVQGASKDALIEALGLEETGEEADPGSREAEFYIGERPNGWVVVFSEDVEWGDQARVIDLSRFGPAVGLQFEDKVEMTATACGATDGVVLWRVHHVNDPLYRLDVTGDPPPELEAIRARQFREQEEDGGEDSDADFIHDIPIEVAKAACGYRADEADEPFLALTRPGRSLAARRPAAKTAGPPSAPAGGGFLSRLFSGFRRD
jgi:hypothetical protein